MQERRRQPKRNERADMPLAWPAYPEIMSTLLGAVGVAGTFLGLGTLTDQGWLTWIGLLAAAAVLGSHVVRHRQAGLRRANARQVLGARLISHCKHLGGSNSMKAFYEDMGRVVLILTDDSLHICQDEVPLTISTTVPLYDIDAVHVGPMVEPRLDADEAPPKPGHREVLNLTLHSTGRRVQRLAFGEFERQAPPTLWAEALAKAIMPAPDKAGSP